MDGGGGGRDEELNSGVPELGMQRWRFCCLIPWCSSRRSEAVGFRWWWWQRIGKGGESSLWWVNNTVKAMKKIREWSEIAAGPKWKTFIRRFNHGGGGGGKSGKFQYDPLSYSLNFEDGVVQNEDIEFQRNFSSRYALITGLKKSSVTQQLPPEEEYVQL